MNDTTYIPKVDKNVIRKLAETIKPVVSKNARGEVGLDVEGNLFYIKPVDLFEIAYTWDPKVTERARGLVKLKDITTYHTYGYYGLFKPSIAEVIAQIPEELLESVVAFEIIESPTTAEDFNKDLAAFNAGYHVATTRLYRSRKSS